ncbi:non-ribosomal peptide synthetase [Paenibacillus helianthi]|uniref:Non-ribosomal peptide synthetase n=1 Tax=Paenibacillus helianthi TaxID=1349432 RepID=A0ABX3EF69_9BACL|nr:non-ribosomal peptide synthetase [Paenibacillus helianthi]OKP79498.1 non-ribosomal peptide synthetase [Paenibacillus helianthi]
MDDKLVFDIGLNEFNLQSDYESKQLEKFNDTRTAYRTEVTIADLFVEQVKLNPNRIAVIDGEHTVTYKDLEEKSNQIARLLLQAGGAPRDLVAVMADRGAEFVASTLAIFKNGMGYVPIDPHYPRQRIQLLLKDSGCKILITQTIHLDKWTIDLPDSMESILCLDQTDQTMSVLNHYSEVDILKQPVAEYASSGKESDTAYVIYTSGSTGQPKGVTITHRQVLNTIFWLNDKFPLDESDVIAQKTSISFTDSVWELFWPLIVGAKLSILKDEEGKSPESLFKWLQTENITITQFVPAMMRLFLSYVELHNELNPLPRLRWVFNGGEAISADLVQDWNRLFQRARIANIYGMTESAIYASVYLCMNAPLSRRSNIPIGAPISNTHIYVLGQSGELCPPGIKGEICIGGSGITDGYLNRPDLTQKEFTSHPVTGERLYRTGDIGCLDKNFILEYWGRKDDQVQVRGYRVELKEVERAILQHPNVRQAAVIAASSEGEVTDLVCYYVCRENQIVTESMRAYLEEVLPVYMVPSYFIQLPEMPLTPHGKIDRKALPDPREVCTAGSQYVSPRNEMEKQLATIWAEVLQVSLPGIDDNFLEHGGHSLKAIQFVSVLGRQLGVKLSVQALLEHQTIRAISEHIAVISESDNEVDILQSAPAEYYPVTPFQEQIYTLREIEGDEPGSNSPGVLRLEGPLDRQKLNHTLAELVKRHEGLRTSFHKIKGIVSQRIHRDASLRIESVKLEDQQIDEVIRSFIRPFDLSIAPLIRIGLIEMEEGVHLLVVDMHHIISDAISKTILLRDFTGLYDGTQLPNNLMQPKEYAVWLRQYERSTSWKREEDYWFQVYKQHSPLLQLPTDHERTGKRTFAGAELRSEMSQGLSARVRQFGLDYKSTLYMMLLTAYSILLSKYGNQEELVIGCDVDNRNRSEFYGSIGAFTNLLALYMKPHKQLAVTDYLSEIKTNVSKSLEHGLYPFNHLLRHVKYDRQIARSPLVESMLTLHQLEQPTRGSSSLQITSYPYKRQYSMLDVALEVIDKGNGLLLSWQYNTGLFDERTIARMNNDFIAVIEQIIALPQMEIGSIQLNHGVALANGEWDAGEFVF